MSPRALPESSAAPALAPLALERPRLSIRVKFTLATLVVFSLTMLTGLLVGLSTELQLYEHFHGEQTKLLASAVRTTLLRGMSLGGPMETTAFLESQLPDRRYFGEVINVALEVVASSRPETVGERRVVDMPPEADTHYVAKSRLFGAPASLWMETLHNEGPCRDCHSKSQATLGYLMVGINRAHLETHKEKVTHNFYVNSLLTLALLLLASWFLVAYLVIRPVNDLIDTMGTVEHEGPAAPSTLRTGDEFQVLGTAFNTMLQRLRRTQEELQKAYRARLAQADRFVTVGELAAGLAHEIKNPLAGLSGALHVLENDFPADSDRRVAIQEMQRQVQRLNRSMNDLLRFSRPAPPEAGAMQIHGCLTRVLDMLAAHKAAAGVQIIREFHASGAIHGDQAQLEQAFLNLGLNALQALDGRGALTVRTRDEAQRVVVEVIDTGAGIAPELQSRVFRPFFTTKTTGTGLGLSIVAQIIEEHGGEIGFSSSPQAGTRFRVVLPHLPSSSETPSA